MGCEVFYVDASCCHQCNKGVWAVVTPYKQYTGRINEYECQDGLSSGYCELKAVEQAIMLAMNRDDYVTIYCDNKSVVKSLNRNCLDENRSYGKYGYNLLLENVFWLYKCASNVSVKWISRKENKLADKLAKRNKFW